ncbi:MAG: SUMF1/EgtB/PvdO family nonheme iron enzyme [Pseudomonadota bacterium]
MTDSIQRRLASVIRPTFLPVACALPVLMAGCGSAPTAARSEAFTDPFAGMVFIQGSCFTMGDVFGDGEPDESPAHEACIDDYYLGAREVTQGEWKALMHDNPAHFKDCGDDCPVENVSWHDAKEYIRRLSIKTARNYRLPTEAEWEFAARARGEEFKWSGTNDEAALSAYAWHGANSGDTTHPAGSKRPNALGLYDMTGNVIEWVEDQWCKRYYQHSPRVNPVCSEGGFGQAARGGSWRSDPRFSRTINRYHDEAGLRSNNHGFRLALSAAGPQYEQTADIQALHAAADYVDPLTGIGFVRVEGGTFAMGDLFGDGHPDYERPVHQVTLADYYIAQTEVTQAQWLRAAGYNPSKYRGPHLPVEQVSWNDIQEWLERLNAKTGQRFRLPTEAEWEYAARSGGKQQKWSGTNNLEEVGDYVWYKWNSNNRTHPVATKRPNGLGLYDMSGSLWEWVADRFNYYTAEPQVNPAGPQESMLRDYRTYRGGAWDYIPELVRATQRSGKEPSYQRSWIGFRIAMDAPVGGARQREPAPGTAAADPAARGIRSWAFVDGGAGLNRNPAWDTYRPQLTALGGKLYAAWREMTPDRGPMHVHVAVYNGDDRAPAWRFVDGGAGLNRNPRHDAFDIQLTAFDSRLYAIWQEDNKHESVIQAAVYNGDDAAPAWSPVLGAHRLGLNYDSRAIASFPQLTVANGKLYATWSEYNETAKQIRVAVYNGNDEAPAWRFVDGNTSAGINKDPTHTANYPQLTALGDKLYATWLENSETSAHIRVAVYNGDDATPRWTFVDEARGPGLNFDSDSTAFYPELTAHAGKLYATWTETGGSVTQARVAVYNGDDQAPHWRFVDGERGINRNSDARAYRPQLTSFGDQLYVTWYEDDSRANTQIRVAVYNGNDQAPAWRLVDGGGEAGLNKNNDMTAVDSQLRVFNGKLYITWKELIGKRGQKIHVAVGR